MVAVVDLLSAHSSKSSNLTMASTLRSTWGFAFVLLLGLFQTSNCIELLFGGSSATLSRNPPQSLSASTLSSVFTSFLGAPSPFPVDEDASLQINQLVSPDFLHRPSTVWAVSLAGLSSQDGQTFEKLKPWGMGDGWTQTGPIELVDDQPVSVVAAVRAARVSVSRQAKVLDLQGGATRHCGDYCLEDALVELSTTLGGSYKPEDAPLRGVLSSKAEDARLDLSNPAVSLWAGELVGVWVEARRLTLSDKSIPALLDTHMLGLQMIRSVFGPDSPEFRLAVEFSWKAMGNVFKLLEGASRELVVQISFLGDVDTVNPNNEYGKVVEQYRRRLFLVSRSALGSFSTKAVLVSTVQLEESGSV